MQASASHQVAGDSFPGANERRSSCADSNGIVSDESSPERAGDDAESALGEQDNSRGSEAVDGKTSTAEDDTGAPRKKAMRKKLKSLTVNLTMCRYSIVAGSISSRPERCGGALRRVTGGVEYALQIVARRWVGRLRTLRRAGTSFGLTVRTPHSARITLRLVRTLTVCPCNNDCFVIRLANSRP
jgi:hypothetical protein